MNESLVLLYCNQSIIKQFSEINKDGMVSNITTTTQSRHSVNLKAQIAAFFSGGEASIDNELGFSKTKSKIVTEESQLNMLVKNIIKAIDNDELLGICKFHGNYKLKRVIDSSNNLNTFVEIKIKQGNQVFIGQTSVSNWNSPSLLNNILVSGDSNGSVIYIPLSDSSNTRRIQIIAILKEL